jgi:uncharacterized membrane protein YdjX (TVP38/TMEM64 family)
MEHTSNQNGMEPNPRKKWLSILVLGLFLIFCGLVGYFIGRPMIRFVSEPEQFRLWVGSHGLLSHIAFVGMVAFQVVLALIPGEPLEIGAGYAFGFWEGTLLCVIGVLLGGMLVFWMTRKWGTKVVSLFFSMEKIQSLKFLQDTQRLHVLTFILFFIPGTPKDLLTYVAGLTPIRFGTYLLISNLARIPSIVTSTIGGNALGEKNYLFAVITFLAVGAFSVVGLLLYRKITSWRAEKKDRNASKAGKEAPFLKEGKPEAAEARSALEELEEGDRGEEAEPEESEGSSEGEE